MLGKHALLGPCLEVQEPLWRCYHQTAHGQSALPSPTCAQTLSSNEEMWSTRAGTYLLLYPVVVIKIFRGTWVAQSVERPTSAQVMV